MPDEPEGREVEEQRAREERNKMGLPKKMRLSSEDLEVIRARMKELAAVAVGPNWEVAVAAGLYETLQSLHEYKSLHERTKKEQEPQAPEAPPSSDWLAGFAASAVADASSMRSGTKPSEPQPTPPGQLVKVSMNLSPATIAILRDLAGRSGTTMTEVVRRGIGLQKFVADETGRGGKLLIEDAKGQMKRVLLP